MEEVKQGSYLKATGMAFLLGMIGVVAYVIVGAYLNMVSSWISFIIGYLIVVGYTKQNGPKKGKYFIYLVLYLFQTFIAVYFTYYLIFISVVPIGLFDVLPLMGELSNELASDLVAIYVFAFLGLITLFANLFTNNAQAKRAQKVAVQNNGVLPTLELGRTQKVLPYQGDYNALQAKIEAHLAKSKYKAHDYHGEAVFRKGDGLWVLGNYIKFSEHAEGIEMITFFLVPKGEFPIDTPVFVGNKKPHIKVVAEIENIIKEHI